MTKHNDNDNDKKETPTGMTNTKIDVKGKLKRAKQQREEKTTYT